jgi:hypothetical protein
MSFPVPFVFPELARSGTCTVIDAGGHVSYSTRFKISPLQNQPWTKGRSIVSAVEHRFEAMTVGMILDRSFRLYAQNFSLMFGITAVFNLPLIVLSALPLFTASTGRTFQAIAVSLGGLVSLIALLIIQPLVTGAVTKAVSDKYIGNPATAAASLKEAWGCVGTLLLTQFVAGLVVILGLMLLVVPGILWMLSYSLIAPVVIIEATGRGQRHVYSLTGQSTVPVVMERSEIRRRSWDLVKGNRGRIFIILAVIFVLSMLLSAGGGSVTSMFFEATSSTARAIRAIFSDVIQIVVSPLQTIAITLMYYDLRIRKEGFDLEMLSQAIGGPTVNA